MTDFQAFNATSHPIVRLEDDWNNLLDHGLAKPCKYLVRVNGSYIEAVNGLTGKISYGGANNVGAVDGTNPHDVIEAALDGLTAGRTYPETVICMGNMELDDHVDINSYTELKLIGHYTMTAATDTNFFMNKDTVGGNTHIYIDGLGAFLDGTGQTATSVGAYFDNVTASQMRNIWAANFINDGISINNSQDIEITNPYCTDNGFRGIYLYTSTKCHIIGGTVKANVDGLVIDETSLYNEVIGLNSEANATGAGIGIDHSSAYNDILGCTSYGNANGLEILTSSYNRVIGGHYFTNVDSGIVIGGTTPSGNIVEGTHCMNNSQGVGVYDAGIAVATGNRNVLKNNVCTDTGATQLYGIRQAGGDYLIVGGNDCYGNVTAPYLFTGANNIYEFNVNSGMPIDLSGAADARFVLHTEVPLWLCRATILYTEATSVNAGITLKIGKEVDDDYYYIGASANGGGGRAQYYSETVNLLANDVGLGDTVAFSSAGGKVGIGEVQLILDYLSGC